jgi:hypothetical protein
MDFVLRPSPAGAQGALTSTGKSAEKEDLKILRDPFLDPAWLKKQKEEEEKRKKAEERKRRGGVSKKRALKLKGIIQVGERFVAIVDGKTLRPGDTIRGCRILTVNRSGIRVLHKGTVRNIFWKPRRSPQVLIPFKESVQ